MWNESGNRKANEMPTPATLEMAAKRGPQRVHRLTPSGVSKAVLPGRYPDGAGLYLHVGPTGGRSWVLRIQHEGRMSEIGLGPLHTVTLAIARRRAQAARLAILDGKHPLEEKWAARAARAKAVTFRDAVTRYVENHRGAWKNPKYVVQWPRSLEQHAYPHIGKLSVAEIREEHVVSVLEPLAQEHPKLASDLRHRIASVLDFARARKWRQGDNPARWTGHLEHHLSMPKRDPKGHAAVPYAELPAVMAALAAKRGESRYADALAFLILTVVRVGPVQYLTWEQITLDPTFGWLWAMPQESDKARKKEFRIPLSGAAVTLLRRQAIAQGLSLSTAGTGSSRGALVFPNEVGKRLREFDRIMEQIGYGQYTPHGFRASYRTWAAETLKVRDYSHEIVEQVLAHKISDATEAAYARAETLRLRRALMEEWAMACGAVATLNVVNA
jgi:integrase